MVLTHRGVRGVALAYEPVEPFVSASVQVSRYADAEAGWAMVHTSTLSLSLVTEFFIEDSENESYSCVWERYLLPYIILTLSKTST